MHKAQRFSFSMFYEQTFPAVYSTGCSKAVVLVLVLLFIALWFILRGDLFYVLPCVILFLCFSVMTSLGEARANLSAFRTSVRFELVWIYLFLLPLGIWEGLRFVIVHSLDFSLTFFFISVYLHCVFQLALCLQRRRLYGVT